MQKSNGLSDNSASGFTRRDFVAATLAVPAAAALVGSTYKAAKSQNSLPIRKEASSVDEAELPCSACRRRGTAADDGAYHDA